jgi:hypothetical protein
MSTEKVISSLPPRDGREWDCQCARCGSSCVWYDCDNCGGEGYVESDDWQDDEDEMYQCEWCRTTGGHWACCSSPDWCEAHPNDGREMVQRGKIEWFTFDAPKSNA